MANENARNLQDKTYIVTRALPTADGTVTSSDIDLGADVYKTETVELEITVPALNATQLPTADTITMTVQAGAAVTPTTSVFVLPVITGSSGYVGGTFRYRLPSNIARYMNVKFVAAGGTGDISASSATIKLLF